MKGKLTYRRFVQRVVVKDCDVSYFRWLPAKFVEGNEVYLIRHTDRKEEQIQIFYHTLDSLMLSITTFKQSGWNKIATIYRLHLQIRFLECIPLYFDQHFSAVPKASVRDKSILLWTVYTHTDWSLGLKKLMLFDDVVQCLIYEPLPQAVLIYCQLHTY